MHAQVWVVVFAVSHECQRVHERHRSVVVVEGERLAQGVTAFDELPSRYFRQQFAHARLGKPVLAPSTCDAVGLDEGDQVVHGGAPGKTRIAGPDAGL